MEYCSIRTGCTAGQHTFDIFIPIWNVIMSYIFLKLNVWEAGNIEFSFKYMADMDFKWGILREKFANTMRGQNNEEKNFFFWYV